MTEQAARYFEPFDLDVTLRDAALDDQNRPTRRMLANAAIGMHVEDAYYSVRELREGGGFALIGLPPSTGFVAKWLLVTSALDSGQWWWVVVLGVGGLLTAVSVTQVLARMLSPAADGAGCRPGICRGTCLY